MNLLLSGYGGNLIVANLWGFYTVWDILYWIGSIFLAGICGVLIGGERSKRLKEAGIRTHCIVAMASAALMILSKYCFADLLGDIWGNKGTDGSRIASQIITGISFLGAGAIFKNGSAVKGLTTAAGIWAVAAIGMAIGSGMWYIGIALTLLILLVQFVMHKFHFGVDSVVSYHIMVTAYNSEELRTALKAKFAEWGAIIEDYSSEKRGEGLSSFNYTLKLERHITDDEKQNFFESRSDIVYFHIKRL